MCVGVAAQCAGKAPNDRVCVGNDVHVCGPDLITSDLMTACAHPTPECHGGACDCTATQCTDACAHLESDRNHCGQCGHACAGECVFSRCRQTLATVTQTNVTVRALVVDDARVYWTNPDDGSVMSVGLAGGSPTTVGTTGQPAGIGGGALAVGGSRVYWTTPGGVWSAPKDGHDQSATRLSSFSGGSSIVVDSTSVYVVGCCNVSSVMKMNLDGSSPTDVATVTIYAGGLAVSGNNVFWTEVSTPWKTVIGSGTKSMVAASIPGAAYPTGLVALTATDLYWVVNGPTTVMRADLDLRNPSTLVPGPGGTGSRPSIVVAADGIYWTGAGLRRAGLGGENPTALVTDVPLAGGIAVDATSVYVATSSGQILKVEK